MLICFTVLLLLLFPKFEGLAMFLEIKDFLKPEEVARLRELAQKVQFVDGRISNPHNKAKNNLQANEADPHYAESSAIVSRCSVSPCSASACLSAGSFDSIHARTAGDSA